MDVRKNVKTSEGAKDGTWGRRVITRRNSLLRVVYYEVEEEKKVEKRVKFMFQLPRAYPSLISREKIYY